MLALRVVEDDDLDAALFKQSFVATESDVLAYHEARDAELQDRSGTHHAWAQCRIENRVLVGFLTSGTSYAIHFAMGNRVAELHTLIMSGRQNGTSANQYRTNRYTGLRQSVEQFLKPGPDGLSPLEKIVGEKITKDNTMFYICGWQGTIDGTMDFMKPKGFVTMPDKREDGSFEVKFESYG